MDYTRITKMIDKTFGWAIPRTFSREEAEELTQEIMLQALKSASTLRNADKFEPWFWRLADITLKVFKRGKAKNRHFMSFDDVADFAFEDTYPFEADEEYQNLRRKIAQLSAAYREIIVLHYYDGLTCKAISQKLGLPEGTVTYRLSLARDKIKERCEQMNESALKPVQLKIRIKGEGDYNGEDKPFPWQYIDDALSQNILWYAYREPKTVEALSELTGVPAFFIEERIENLYRRDAIVRPQKATVQTNFIVYDREINSYAPAHSGDFAAAVSAQFLAAARQLTDETLALGLQPASRSHDEICCLLSAMVLDAFVADYQSAEYKRFGPKYDGGLWEYTGFLEDGSCGGDVGIGIEKSMNSYESGKLTHYSYHFAPFAYRKMLRSHEMDVCQSMLQKSELSESQKECAAQLLAGGYLAKNKDGEIICTIPAFTKAQHEQFLASAKRIFADFLPFYADEVKKYLAGYTKLFPKHLKEATERNSYYVFIALLKAVAADWLRSGKITLPHGTVCDVLIQM